MSDEEKELFFSIIREIYLKGTTCGNLSMESFLNEIKEKLHPVLLKDIEMQKEG